MRALALVWVFAASVALAQDVPLAGNLNERVVSVPLTTPAGEQVRLVATTFHPQGAGPFPLIVLSHGSPADGAARAKMGRWRRIPQVNEFIDRGFAVIVPMRRGYGDTGGKWVERYGRCADPDYYGAGREAARDVIAAVKFASGLRFVQRERIILVGQSAGGFASIAAASENPPGLIAVVNFSGGRGGNPKTRPGEPCGSVAMAEAIARFAKTITVPVLWHYVENDKYFSPEHVRAWFEAFEHGGGKGRLVIQPPFGKDGHGLFVSMRGIPIWTKAFDNFLAGIGFTR
jgi:dienelactone hydrolase